MQTFKSLSSVFHSGLPPDILQVVHRAMTNLLGDQGSSSPPYSPDDDGFVVLLTPSDGEGQQQDVFGTPLKEAPFEGVFVDGPCFVAVLLRNNQYGLTIVIPNAPWLDPALRQKLLNELCPSAR